MIFLTPPIVKSQLNTYVDFGNKRCYSGSGLSFVDLITKNTGAITTAIFSPSNGGVLDLTSTNFGINISMPPLTFSISVTFKATMVGDYFPLFSINGWGDFNMHSSINGELYVGTDIPTRFNPADTGGSNAIVSGSWYNLVFTFNAGSAKLYKNTVLIASKVGMGNPATAPAATANFGASSGMLFSEGKVYNKELTPTEILQNYNAIKAKFGL